MRTWALTAVVTVAVLAPVNAQRVTLAAIHGYQHALSPVMTQAGTRCRFTPTCSRYAEAAIRRDGALRGGWKAIKRVARCTPLTRPGTVDEP